MAASVFAQTALEEGNKTFTILFKNSNKTMKMKVALDNNFDVQIHSTLLFKINVFVLIHSM